MPKTHSLWPVATLASVVDGVEIHKVTDWVINNGRPNYTFQVYSADAGSDVVGGYPTEAGAARRIRQILRANQRWETANQETTGTEA